MVKLEGNYTISLILLFRGEEKMKRTSSPLSFLSQEASYIELYYGYQPTGEGTTIFGPF